MEHQEADHGGDGDDDQEAQDAGGEVEVLQALDARAAGLARIVEDLHGRPGLLLDGPAAVVLRAGDGVGEGHRVGDRAHAVPGRDPLDVLVVQRRLGRGGVALDVQLLPPHRRVEERAEQTEDGEARARDHVVAGVVRGGGRGQARAFAAAVGRGGGLGHGIPVGSGVEGSAARFRS